jgi:IclR family KDG regulon transcriptional repressor
MTKTAKPNISKSVARAFEVFELFRQRQTPMTAAQVRHALSIPQPSTRALLRNLVELGYLNFEEDEKTYFPSMQFAHLGDWISNTVLGGTDIARLVDDIALETGETTSANIINALNLEILYARTAAHPLGLNLRPGIGDALWLSAAGRTLISALPDDERERIIAATIRQERNPKKRREILSLSTLFQDIRSKGYCIGYDIYLQGVGAVCVSASFGEQPTVIAVAGARDRIQSAEKRILRTIRSELRRRRSK